MALKEREDAILSYLQKRKEATVAELCAALFVSEPTMRRDLARMNAAGRIIRTYGGASLRGEPGENLPLALREREHSDAKAAIGRKCLSLISDGDVVMVDGSAAALQRADSALDIMCVEGNGASISVLKSAGAADADLVIAVTNGDETNLVCCLIAKKLGAKHTIARVRNTDYRRDADMLKEEIGLDMVINPDLAAAREIARILSFPAAFSVEPFARGRIDMIGFQFPSLILIPSLR